jgi:hypothetical protein
MTFNQLKYEVARFFRAFFPIQLLFAHVKYNIFSLFFWIILFSIASDGLGSSFGVPFLFYSPEYRGETNWISFLLIGFSIGGFTMAFNTYSYVKMSKKFPFLLTISHSFIKFCLNNSIIPISFLIFFIIQFTYFQIVEEFASAFKILIYIVSFLFGYTLFILISFLYFFPKNKRIFKKYSFDKTEGDEKINSFLNRNEDWVDYFKYKKDRTYIYLATLTKWKLTKKTEHYDKKMMDNVLKKTKISSFLFEFTTIISFFLVGIFRENSFLDLPAGMSLIMLLAIIMMIYSALYSWLNYWTFPIIVTVLIFMNFFSKNSTFFQYKNYAYGLNYSEENLKKYTYQTIDSLNSNIIQNNRSKREYIKALNQWKNKTNKNKPKLIIVLTSGGGSRSALWTFSVLNYLDQNLNKQVTKHTQLITGASGGMIGAAYYRSLYLNYYLGEQNEIDDAEYYNNISKDLLNKLSFSAYSNDLLFRIQSFNLKNQTYTKDRGFSFEEHLNDNTNKILNKPLDYFKKYERFGMIPVMIFTPTIVNDGRRMLISSQNLNFLCSGKGTAEKLNNLNENIDFQSFFNNNTDVRFLSVLRMSATFPLVLPMVSLPTIPEINIMDAGIRDNYGVKLSLEYLFALKDWINENTSGVILLKIRDTKKILEGENIHKVSLFEKFSLPFGNMYQNFTRTQDFDQDELMKISAFSFPFQIDLVEFNLRETSKDRISLSWHLTSQEKNKIKNAILTKGNQHALMQIKTLLK